RVVVPAAAECTAAEIPAGHRLVDEGHAPGRNRVARREVTTIDEVKTERSRVVTDHPLANSPNPLVGRWSESLYGECAFAGGSTQRSADGTTHRRHPGTNR